MCSLASPDDRFDEQSNWIQDGVCLLRARTHFRYYDSSCLGGENASLLATRMSWRAELLRQRLRLDLGRLDLIPWETR